MAPVIVELHTGKAVFLAVLSGCLALLIGVPVIGMILAVGELNSALVVGLGLIAVFVAATVFNIGLARRKPVALRMDSKGISGYYAEPATWPEIMEITCFQGSKGARYLGFAFLNPDTIRARQTTWSILNNWSLNPRYRYQIVIAQARLKDADVETLAAIAQAFQRAA